MLTITEPVRVTRKREYVNKRGRTVKLLRYVPLDGAGGEHEVYIPDDLNGGCPEAGTECSLVVEKYLYPGVGTNRDGDSFGTWNEGERLYGYIAPTALPVTDLASAA